MGFNFSQFVDELSAGKTDQTDAIVTKDPIAYNDWTDDDLLELFSERAAIMEYSGGLSRQTAERAMLDWMKSEIGESRYKVWGSKPNNVQSEKVVTDPARPATVLPNYEGVE